MIFSNQKGGVGKTTLTRELGIYAGKPAAQRCSWWTAIPRATSPRAWWRSRAAGCTRRSPARASALTELDESLSLLAGDFRLALLEKSLIGEIDAYTRLRDAPCGLRISAPSTSSSWTPRLPSACSR